KASAGATRETEDPSWRHLWACGGCGGCRWRVGGALGVPPVMGEVEGEEPLDEEEHRERAEGTDGGLEAPPALVRDPRRLLDDRDGEVGIETREITRRDACELRLLDLASYRDGVHLVGLSSRSAIAKEGEPGNEGVLDEDAETRGIVGTRRSEELSFGRARIVRATQRRPLRVETREIERQLDDRSRGVDRMARRPVPRNPQKLLQDDEEGRIARPVVPLRVGRRREEEDTARVDAHVDDRRALLSVPEGREHLRGGQRRELEESMDADVAEIALAAAAQELHRRMRKDGH